VVASAANLASFYINPDPSLGTAVPLGKYDLLSVLTHEFGHGLGFLGLINRASPTLGQPPVASGSAIGIYDEFVSYTTAGATFTGSGAEAAYAAFTSTGSGVAVPLFYTAASDLSVENFYHLDGSYSDLMDVALPAGTYQAISNIDLGILADTGVPVTATVACFARSTMIRTPSGDVAVEDLAVGDAVVTAGGGEQPVVWTGWRRVDCRRHPRPADVLPVRVQCGAFGAGMPERDLFVSPDHAIYFDGVLIPARSLVNGLTVTREDRSVIDYYHIELPAHGLLFANGLVAESYLDTGDRAGFRGSGNVVQLLPLLTDGFGSGDRWEALGCAPLRLRGPEVEAARAHLMARAGSRAA